MSTMIRTPQALPASRRRAFVTGFTIGAVGTLPVVLLALMLPVVERLLPVLLPGVTLLRPLGGVLADWPGPVNLLVGSVANGLAVGVLLAAVSAALTVLRPRRSRPSRS